MLCLFWPLLSIFLAVAQGNTAPQFHMSSSFSLPEDTPIGTWLFQLVAIDADNDILSYSITGEYAYYFSVNRPSGNVTLRQRVDYEETKLIVVDAEVTDNENVPVKKKLTIIVTDCNDNKPIFQNEPYFTDVPESTAIGSSIYTVLALDADSGSAGRVSYTIEEVIPNNPENHQLFYILFNGTVVLNGSLSYNNKSTFYRIKILATDGGGLLNGMFVYQNNTAYLSVTVVDVADLDPQFLGAPYTGAVPENCPLGTSVLTVWAIDEDKGVNDAISYNITNATSLFTIDPQTGLITVSGPLDREGVPGEQVQLQVVAQEKDLNIYQQVAQVSTIVTIQVMDTNDNKPQFYLCVYPACNFTDPPEDTFTGEIEEHASARTPVANLSIVAYDPDKVTVAARGILQRILYSVMSKIAVKGTNGTFQLSLQGPDARAFSISPHQIVNEGTVQVLVSNSTLVDYEKAPIMIVEIVANDTGLATADCCSFATVNIHLIDINDHRPEFSQSDYKLYVMEESPPGTIVASNITATDPDTGEFGRITYQLLPQSILSTFTVNATSGTILVANGSNLDWGFRSVYYVTLQATDGGGLVGSTQLEISVVDINNNPPVVTGSYNVFVNENQDNVQVQIQATDKDEPDTNNSRLQFEIVPGEFSDNFTIDPDTGVLRSKGPLDREAIPMERNGIIVVTVLVHDIGVPQLNTTVDVTFTVEDENDNAPRFSSSFYNFSVPEGMEGIVVGAVEATDADQTLINNRITFHLEGSSNFLIRSVYLAPGCYQGNLSLVQVLDYEEQKYFNLTVEAENSDSSEKVDVDTASVRVNVLDVNDEPPALVPSPPQDINVFENTPMDTSVETMNATDKDTNHSLIFWELDVKCFNDSGDIGDVCQNWFQLEPNGSLIVKSPGIDFEVCNIVKLTLRVEDEFTEKGDRYSRNETQRILIVDQNDNPPTFLESSETFGVVIPEIFPVNLQVAVVKATDADSGVNGVITFAISRIIFIPETGEEQNFVNLFKVVTTSEEKTYIGSIQIASNLDINLKGHYQVTVMAEDNGDHPLNSSISLDIYTVDKSYRIGLMFNAPLKDVQANTDKIKVLLRQATQASVYVAAIKSIDDASASRSVRASEKSSMEAYFTYPNGTALTADQVHMGIQKDPELQAQLINLGLSMIGPVEVQEVNNEKMLFGVIAGLAVAVLLILFIMIGMIMGMRKSYRRKLKALKAMKVASAFSANAVHQGPAIPGTNKYNMEGANPVLGFSLYPTLDQEENSFEKVSLNSLDENTVDDPGNDPSIPELKLGTGVPKCESDKWNEPLKVALEGFSENKQLKQPQITSFSLDNPCLDTTDL